MKTKKLSQILTVLGTLLMLYAIVGRFLNGITCFGYVIPAGVSAQSVMLGANTILLLAILAYLYTPKAQA